MINILRLSLIPIFLIMVLAPFASTRADETKSILKFLENETDNEKTDFHVEVVVTDGATVQIGEVTFITDNEGEKHEPSGQTQDGSKLTVNWDNIITPPGETIAVRIRIEVTGGEIVSVTGYFTPVEDGDFMYPLAIELTNFTSNLIENHIYLNWMTVSEISNLGFKLWRGKENGNNNYEPILLKEFGHPEQVDPDHNENCSTKIQGQLEIDNSSQPPKLISTVGNSVESTCYSFTDTSNPSDGTYYYLLEDIDDDGKSTFHCDHVDAVTIGQGPAIDLESAINYCKEVTGSNN